MIYRYDFTERFGTVLDTNGFYVKHSDYIALKERADALADVLDSFDVSCNEKSTYKDCYLTFIDPHAMTMRLRNCSSKSFIIADLARRRKDALAAYRNGDDGQ